MGLDACAPSAATEASVGLLSITVLSSGITFASVGAISSRTMSPAKISNGFQILVAGMKKPSLLPASVGSGCLYQVGDVVKHMWEDGKYYLGKARQCRPLPLCACDSR